MQGLIGAEYLQLFEAQILPPDHIGVVFFYFLTWVLPAGATLSFPQPPFSMPPVPTLEPLTDRLLWERI